ncbi:MAG: hypothetical protein P4L63_02775 [Candidatus Pacebacteria bacterium]|nr:hypothetical protein [Candidatus Paceibacterota bacterium]
MTDELKTTIKKEIEKLPKETQDVLTSFDWVKLTEEIGKKYLLSKDDINNLQVETLLILTGIEDIDSYIDNIESEVGTSKNEAEKISGEITQKIFIPINDLLIDKVKQSDKIKNSKPEENINFVLSGGDYSAFLEPREETVEEEEPVVPVFSLKEENFKK